jgi:C-terminal processing protease CtpA/Prc
MRPTVGAVLAFAVMASACSGGITSGSPVPTRSPNINRSALDIAYSAFVDQDVHHVTSKKALEAALQAVRGVIKDAAGKGDVATPELQDVDSPQTADFDKFANAVSQLAASNPDVSATKISDAAIVGMIAASPDCHTYYLDSAGGVHRSSGKTGTGSGAMPPAAGASLGGPDQDGVTGKMLPGGIAYITWRQFEVTGTYKITDAVKAILDKALAQGAKGWVFDLRGNIGGNGADIMASWFLNGEPTLSVLVKTGNAGTQSGNKAFRLPAAYQLPIVIILNDRGGSDPEVLAASLKESKRATIVGKTSIGCLGATAPTHMTNGAELSVAVQEYTGAVTGTKYNNIGIVPDVAVDDAAAVDKAIEILKQKIAGG